MPLDSWPSALVAWWWWPLAAAPESGLGLMSYWLVAVIAAAIITTGCFTPALSTW